MFCQYANVRKIRNYYLLKNNFDVFDKTVVEFSNLKCWFGNFSLKWTLKNIEMDFYQIFIQYWDLSTKMMRRHF